MQEVKIIRNQKLPKYLVLHRLCMPDMNVVQMNFPSTIFYLFAAYMVFLLTIFLGGQTGRVDDALFPFSCCFIVLLLIKKSTVVVDKYANIKISFIAWYKRRDDDTEYNEPII